MQRYLLGSCLCALALGATASGQTLPVMHDEGKPAAADHDHGPGAAPCHADHEDRFDFFRPFHSEYSRGAEGHDDHENLGPDRHHSVEGYPFFHPLRTEHAYIERSIEPGYGFTKNADNRTLDSNEVGLEIFWALNNRISINFGIPYRALNPDEAPNTSGFGDLEVGLQFVAFNSKHSIVSFALNVEVPTGDSDRGLGEGRTVLEPTVFWLYDLGSGTVMQSQLAVGIPVGIRGGAEPVEEEEGEGPEEEPLANELIFNMALGHTLLGTTQWPTFRNLTPFIEVNGRSILNGPELHRTFVDLTPGLYWNWTERDEMSVGCSFPVTGNRDSDYQFLIAFFRHY